METVWMLKGPQAGSFVPLEDDEAKSAIESGRAQKLDGSALELAENHPQYVKPARKKKYPNKMLKTDG